MEDATGNAVNYGKSNGIQSVGSSNSPYDPTARLYGRQVLSGTVTGNLNVVGSVTVSNTDGSLLGMGAIPDNSGDFGFYAQDSNGNLLYKIVGSTIYAYDVTRVPATNIMQILKLPDGTYGWAVAAPGKNVSDGIS